MGNGAKIILTIGVAAAAMLAIPPTVSALAAPHALPAEASHTGGSAAAWEFMPISAEMGAAIRLFKAQI